ncbi:MAG TPA: Mpo1-like protein, partial [Gammaproteobacteria bacterium]|nr:Mpo1-like protein [Gammaproteobacteria bacterium]
MKTADEWLADYGRTHRDGTNKIMHWICVPIIVVSIVGLLWSAPVPETFSRASPVLNWGTVFLMAAVVYYFIMSISL